MRVPPKAWSLIATLAALALLVSSRAAASDQGSADPECPGPATRIEFEFPGVGKTGRHVIHLSPGRAARLDLPDRSLALRVDERAGGGRVAVEVAPVGTGFDADGQPTERLEGPWRAADADPELADGGDARVLGLRGASLPMVRVDERCEGGPLRTTGRCCVRCGDLRVCGSCVSTPCGYCCDPRAAHLPLIRAGAVTRRE